MSNFVLMRIAFSRGVGFDHATILSAAQFPRSPQGTPGTMTLFCVLNTKKNTLQFMSLAAYASETKKNCNNLAVNKKKLAYLISYNRHI